MTKWILGSVAWLGRTTAMVMGLALMLAVVLGVATAALGAVPGDPFRLGQLNTINALTQLVGSVNNAMLRIDNNSAGATATALDLQVQPGKAPMKVNSSARVANLNADRLDGKHADQLVRVASFTGSSPLPDGTNGTVATTSINAPASGFLVIDAGSDFFNFSGDDTITCFIEVDNARASGSLRYLKHDANSSVNEDEDCSTSTVVPVAAGNHTVDLEAQVQIGGGTQYGETALSAIYIPFGGSGASPSAAATSAALEQGADQERLQRNR